MTDEMSHGFVLIKEMQDKHWLHAKQESGLVRASFATLHGLYDGFAFTHAPEPLEMTTRSAPVCVPGMPCDPYELLNFLTSRGSSIEPASCIAFILHEVVAGQREATEAHVKAVEKGAKGVKMAAAHMLGRGRYHALTEVVSNDREAFLRTLVRVTDFAGFASSHILRVLPGDTRGMGEVSKTADS